MFAKLLSPMTTFYAYGKTAPEAAAYATASLLSFVRSGQGEVNPGDKCIRYTIVGTVASGITVLTTLGNSTRVVSYVYFGIFLVDGQIYVVLIVIWVCGDDVALGDDVL